MLNISTIPDIVITYVRERRTTQNRRATWLESAADVARFQARAARRS